MSCFVFMAKLVDFQYVFFLFMAKLVDCQYVFFCIYD